MLQLEESEDELEVEIELDLFGLFLLLMSPSSFCGGTSRRCRYKFYRDQLYVLSALDATKTQWYHFTAIVVTGMGFFTDAYDLFSISLVTKLLGHIYYHVDGAPKPGTLPPNISVAVNSVALCVTLLGLLLRQGPKSVIRLITTLCFFQFWLGFGTSGDYPLSATIMSEYANKKTRGAFIAAVFAMQSFGILAGGLVATVVSFAFKTVFKASLYSINSLGSTVPQMPETARYKAVVAKDAKQVAEDMSKVLQVEIVAEQEKVKRLSQNKKRSFGLFSKEFVMRHVLHLLGTATTWFLVDVAYYSQNLFQKDIFSAIGWIPLAQSMNAL
ncbi:hypothetical protein Syun_019139 [Stephania yunnanensis]|uniref:Uncharacterized protein n=1 Tax=Stephania yunnanensis TaxID=152371 RepID=A0AAP0NVM9_9MAGN